MATRSHVREVVVQLLYAYSSGNNAIFKFADEIFEEAENRLHAQKAVMVRLMADKQPE